MPPPPTPHPQLSPTIPIPAAPSFLTHSPAPCWPLLVPKGLDHKQTTIAYEMGPWPVWVWIRAGCLEEGASELSGRHCWQRREAEGGRPGPVSTMLSVTPISGCLGFPICPCPPPPPLPGTLTSGWATAWNPLPGVTGETELRRTLSLRSGWAVCAPTCCPPGLCGQAPASPCSTPNTSMHPPLPKKASVPRAWTPPKGPAASLLLPAQSLFLLWVRGWGTPIGAGTRALPAGLRTPPSCLFLSTGSSNVCHPPNLEKEVFPAPPAGTGLPPALDDRGVGRGTLLPPLTLDSSLLRRQGPNPCPPERPLDHGLCPSSPSWGPEAKACLLFPKQVSQSQVSVPAPQMGPQSKAWGP